MNILIVKLSAIGDVIHTLPSLAALRRLYPEAHITWVVEEAAADLVRNHPYLNEILVSRRKSWLKDVKNGRWKKPFQEAKAFINDLRKQRYDLVIDFHGLLKSSVIVLFSRGKRKLGYDSLQELSGLFINEKIPEDFHKHAVDRYLDFPRHLGAQIKDVEFTLPQNPSAEEKIKNLMRKYDLEEKKFIAINPIAYWETKLWENKNFAHLADRIQNDLGIKVVFTGTERKSLEKITALMTSPAINLGGQTTLPELACLYSRAKMLISTDSGPMHLAAAVQTPVVALFGPTDPQRTGPYGAGHTVLRTAMDCSPCFLKKCSTKLCMTGIHPEHVLSAVKKNLQGES